MKNKVQTYSIIRSMMKSTAITMISYLVLVGILSYLVVRGTIGESNQTIAICITLALGIIISSLINGKQNKERVILFTSILTIAILLILNIIVFHGNFHHVIYKILSIGLGGIIGVVISMKNGNKNRKRKRHR